MVNTKIKLTIRMILTNRAIKNLFFRKKKIEKKYERKLKKKQNSYMIVNPSN